MNCTKCDAKNEEYARYCWNCGTPTHVSKIRNRTLLRVLNSEWLGLTQALPKLLYIGALFGLCTQLFVAIAITIDSGLSWYVVTLILGYLSNGLFYAGVLIGFAGIISTQTDPMQRKRLCRNLYIFAACVLVIAIIILAINVFIDTPSLWSFTYRMGDYLKSFVYSGLFLFGILIGLGALNIPRQDTEAQYFSPVVSILYLSAVAIMLVGIIATSLGIIGGISEDLSDISEASFFLRNFGLCIFYGGIIAALGRLVSLRNRRRNAPDLEDEELEEEEETSMDGPTTP